MNIHYLSPYALDKNFGKAYNEACALVPDGDWICVRDGDVMFLTPEWGHHIEHIANFAVFAQFSLVGCMTNRLSTASKQLVQGHYNTHDIRVHNTVAKNLWATNHGIIEPFDNVLAGHFLLFPKSTWIKTKFEENTMHFDSRFSNAVNGWGKQGLATGLYVYHWYRGDSEYKQPEYDSQHLQK